MDHLHPHKSPWRKFYLRTRSVGRPALCRRVAGCIKYRTNKGSFASLLFVESLSRSTAAVETGIFTWRTRQNVGCPLDLISQHIQLLIECKHHRTNDICTGWVLWPSAAANYRESLKIFGLVCSSQQTHGMAFHSALSIPKRTPIVVWRHRTEVWTRCDWLSCYTTVHTIIYFRLSSLHNFHSSSSSPSIASTDAP